MHPVGFALMGHDAKLNQSNSGVQPPSHSASADAIDITDAFAVGSHSGPARARSPVRAVFLDIDGTLVDSNDAHACAWSAACIEFGFKRPVKFFRPLIGMGGDHVLPRVDPTLSEDNGPGRAIANRRSEIFKSTYLPGLRPTPGARALVEHLHGCGLRCVVATSSKSEDLEALLEIANVTEFIDVRTTAEDAAKSKPAPDIVNAALAKAQVPADQVIFLGDTPYDVKSGQQAGVAVIGLRCGGWDDLGLAGAIAIYDDPADLLAQYDASPLVRR